MDQIDATEDQSSNIITSVSVLTALSAVFLALRIWCKAYRHRGLWWDDWVLLASWVALAVSAVISAVNARNGFGKHFMVILTTAPQTLPGLGFFSYLAGTFSILAAVLSKTSFAITLLRIMTGWTKAVVWFSIITINLAMGMSIIISWVQCTPTEKVWNVQMEGTCWSPKVYSYYGMVAAAYSGIIDIMLAFLPWYTIRKLQMKKAEKLGVGIAMCMGVFAGITAMVKTAQIPSLDTGDFTYYGTGLVIWGTAEGAVTIIAASIPILRVLIREAARSRYASNEKKSTGKSKIDQTFAVEMNSRARGGDRKGGAKTKLDDQSDRSILNGNTGHSIMHTTEVHVESRERTDSDSERVPYGFHAV